MLNPHLMLMIFVLSLMSGTSTLAQDYPNKPLRMYTSTAGGGTDFGARIVAQGLAASLGQSVVVDNRVAILSIETVAKAPADGYSLLFAGGTLWIVPLLQSVSYDPMRDFAPITFSGRSPAVVVVHPSLPVKSVRELIDLAKARPGQLNYSSGGVGSSGHLGAELFKSMAGINIVSIQYKGGGPALVSIIGGETQVIINPPPPIMPHMKTGRLRALAVTSLQPSDLLPGLPSVSQSGLPGFEVISPDGVFAPAKTAPAIVNRLRQEIVRDLNRAEVKQKFFDVGIEIVGNTPEEAVAFIRNDSMKWAKVIKEVGIKAP